MIKRLLIVVAMAVLVFAGVLTANALVLPSKQVTVTPAPALTVDLDAAVARLSKAVTFKTISYQDPAEFDGDAFAGMHTFMAEAYPKLHAALQLERVGTHSLLFTWPGTDPALKPIVLLAHQDVVPVVPGTEDDWEQDAYSGVVADGFIWGRGTLDDKSSLFSILEAVEMLLAEGKQPKRTVILFFGHDEEVSGIFGASAAADLLHMRGVEAEFVLDEGGAIVSGAMPGLDAPVATIGVAEKGYMTVKLAVKMDGGHSSQPPRATAIGILSRAIARLEEHQMPGGIQGLSEDMLMHVGPEMSFGMRMIIANLWLTRPLVQWQFGGSPVMNAFMRTTTAPTIIQGGSKENVLPPEVMAIINFRILPGDSREDIVAHIQSVVRDDRVQIEPFMDQASEASIVSPSEGPQFEVIARTVREVVPDVVTTPYLVLGATDSRYFTKISPNVYRFAPMTIHNEDLKRMHGTNERLGTKAYGTMIRFYHRLLENAAM